MRRIIPTALIAAAVVLLAAAGTVAAQATQRFADVAPDAYYYDAVNWAVDNGITVGCGDGTNFCPHDTLTRAHMVTFLYRANTSTFSGIGDTVTDDVTLEPGYYTVRVHFLPAPGYDWDDGRDHDFYAWFGSKRGGVHLVTGKREGESANENAAVHGSSYYRVNVDDVGDDHWFIIEADDRFVWWAEAHRNSTPDGAAFN